MLPENQIAKLRSLMDDFNLDSTFDNLEQLVDDTSISQENLAALANLNTQETYAPQPPVNGINSSPDKILNKINAIIQDYTNLIQQKQLHPLSSINCYETKSIFNIYVQKLKWVLQQYKVWASLDKDPVLNRYLNLLKDQSNLENSLENLKSGLDESQSIGQKYILSYSNSKSDTITSNYQQQNLLQIVSQIAEELELQYFVEFADITMDNLDDMMDSEEGQHTTASLSSAGFLLDVLISNKGEVHAVKLTSMGEDPNPSFDQDLTDTLKSNTDLFKRKIRVLSNRDVLSRSYPNIDVKKLLKLVEQDIITVYSREKMFHNDLDIMLTYSGVPRVYTEGLYVYYYISPLNLIENVDKYSKASYFLLDIEQSDVDKPNPLPMESHIQSNHIPTIEKPFIYNNNTTNINNYPLHYVLNLFPPLLLSLDSLKQILFPSQNFESPHCSVEDSLQYKLIKKDNNNLFDSTLTNASSTINIENRSFKFVYSGPWTEGIKINRIPFVHLKQLDLIVKILRQQSVFNELFASCFHMESVLNNSSELSVQAPSLLFITFYHPIVFSLLSLEVQVKLNGVISAKLNYPDDTKPVCSSEYISTLLSKSCSIPLTLHYLIKKL